MSESYTDTYIRHQIRVENLKEGEASRVAALLREHQRAYIRRLDRDLTLTKAQRDRLLARYNKATERVYAEIAQELRSDGLEATAKSVRWHERALAGLGAAGADMTADEVEALYQRVVNRPYDGKPFASWLDGAEKKDKAMFRRAINAAWVRGENPSADLRNAFNVSVRDSRAITRSYFGHLANESRNEVFDEYEVERVQWLSTLDGRTTEMCMVRDGLHYTVDGEPIDHGYEWGAGPGSIHWNCRSTAVPVIEDTDVTYTRPAVGPGPEYEKGDLTTRTGRVRKPTKANRDSGKLKPERVRTDTNYSKWLSRQPAEFQDEVLGADAAKQFRESGDLTQVFRPNNEITAAQF